MKLTHEHIGKMVINKSWIGNLCFPEKVRLISDDGSVVILEEVDKKLRCHENNGDWIVEESNKRPSARIRELAETSAGWDWPQAIMEYLDEEAERENKA